MALTRVEMRFFNPNRRVLEGELQFPLLDGQAIAGFALDIDGVLREAVPVEKARGQAVFEDITRQRVDPALMQATQGNNFKLRVYPLMPGQTRTVVLRYSERLAAAGGRRVYRLPLSHGQGARAFSVHARVKQSPGAPTVSVAGLQKAAPRRAGGDWIAVYEQTAAAADGMLEIAVPAVRSPVAYTQMLEGRTYFFAEVPVPVRKAPRPAPRVVALAWDSSGSGESRDHAKELALLGAYLRWMRNGEVILVRVRDRAETAERFRVVDGDWLSLRRALQATAYDGATQLGSFVAPADAEEVLLFSDGLANFGDSRPHAGGKPLHVICAAAKSDPAMLRGLAEANGGRFVDLLAEPHTEAAARLTHHWTRVASIDADGADEIVSESVYPKRGRIALAGVLRQPTALLRIALALPQGGRQTVELPVHAAADPGGFAAGLWARLRIAQLEAEHELHRAEIRRLGKAFGLVTRETSLIVLDRVEDYVRHEIAPPQELRAAYERLTQMARQRREADRKSHLERVVRLFEDKQAWWSKEFPKGDRPARIAADAAREQGESSRDLAVPDLARSESRERQAPAAAPARRPAAAEGLASGSAMAKGARADPAARPIAIQFKPWTPDAPYARRMREAEAKSAYRIYLDEKRDYASSTAFFLDAADLLLEKKENELAVRVLTNLAEMDLENRHILRILGYRLLQAGDAAAAVSVFRRVLELSPEEPQSWRDLGLALAANGQRQKAVEALYEVVARPWHGRFPEIELITLAELNAVVTTARDAGDTLELGRFDPRLLKNLPLDLRVVLTWDADNTDIDLWVTDPNGEKAYYGNRLSWQGGRMSQDFTGGYGPEEFSLRSAKPGRYKVEAQFYGHRQQIISGATTLQMKLTTHFGTKIAQEKLVTLRLTGQSEVVYVADFEVR
jgi:tetratricopeptide (TPR) repeat protein